MNILETDMDLLGLFVCFFLVVVGLCCCTGFSLVERSRGYTLVAMLWLLFVVASLVAEHQL